jgi:hypothetical protein
MRHFFGRLRQRGLVNGNGLGIQCTVLTVEAKFGMHLMPVACAAPGLSEPDASAPCEKDAGDSTEAESNAQKKMGQA